jgi:putative nucleotidyltransferase with HDIG domain
MAKTLEYIRELFPEIEQISDIDLRQKVYKTWLEAWKLSPCDRLEQIPFLEGILPEINNVEHTKAVIALSIHFAKMMKEFLNIKVNMDYLIAGAILHDIGKCFEFIETPTDLGRLFSHSISAAYVAAKENLPLEIIHIIAAHSLEGDLIKRTPEAAIVHYMDFAYSEVTLRAKTKINVDEWRKVRGFKKLFSTKRKNDFFKQILNYTGG